MAMILPRLFYRVCRESSEHLGGLNRPGHLSTEAISQPAFTRELRENEHFVFATTPAGGNTFYTTHIREACVVPAFLTG